MKVLKTFSPKVEIYSIDEAFIDLSFIDEKGIEDYEMNKNKSFKMDGYTNKRWNSVD